MSAGNADDLDCLQLIRTDNVGPITYRDLIRRFGTARKALEVLPELAARGGRKISIPTRNSVEAEFAYIERFGARLVKVGDRDFPEWLRHIDAAPPILIVKGRSEVLASNAVSIVGARNASAAGMKMTSRLAKEIGQAGYAIVSGLARGIDTAAHHASLATGTIAVVAGGIDRLYPPENRDLFDRISETGIVVSEMPMGWEPRARDFPRRNRIVAGIGLGLVVVEAAQRSGSLISARLAAEFGRLVFAVPGSPLDPRAAGTNGLLKNGAILVTEAIDVLDQIAPQLPRNHCQPLFVEEPSLNDEMDETTDSDRQRLLTALSAVPTSIDDLLVNTGLSLSQIALLLLELDLAGRLERHPGGKVSIVF